MFGRLRSRSAARVEFCDQCASALDARGRARALREEQRTRALAALVARR